MAMMIKAAVKPPYIPCPYLRTRSIEKSLIYDHPHILRLFAVLGKIPVSDGSYMEKAKGFRSRTVAAAAAAASN